MDYEKGLIKMENSGKGKLDMVTVLDDHKRHILAHIAFIWRKGMLSHIIEHFKLWKQKRSLGIGFLNGGDLIKAVVKRNEKK